MTAPEEQATVPTLGRNLSFRRRFLDYWTRRPYGLCAHETTSCFADEKSPDNQPLQIGAESTNTELPASRAGMLDAADAGPEAL